MKVKLIIILIFTLGCLGGLVAGTIIAFSAKKEKE